MLPPGGRTRAVLLGAGLGGALVLLGLGEVRVGLGGVTALVSLLPLALAVALGGPVAGAVALAVGVGGAALLLSPPAATALALRHAMPGVALGVVLARRWPLAVGLSVVGAAGVLGLLALLVVLVPRGPGPLVVLFRELEAHLAELEQWPGRLAATGATGWIAESAQLVVGVLRVAAPGMLWLGLLLVALVNYGVARLCLRGGGFRPFAEEAVPDHLVWVVIAGGVLVTVHPEPLARIGLNLLIALAPLYTIQGLAVLRHWFLKAGLPRPLQGLGFGLFAVQPILLIAAAGLGLSDLWIDFRKIRRAATPA